MCVSIVPLSRVCPLLSSFQTYYLSWFKAGLEKEYNETTLPARLEKFEALLKSRDEGKGFFLGDKLTYADISFFDFFNGYIAGGQPTIPKELQKFPLLAEHYNRVLNVPEIKTWIAKRPASFF